MGIRPTFVRLLGATAISLACQGSAKTAVAPQPTSQAPLANPTTQAANPAPEPARQNLRTGSIVPVLHDISRRLEVIGRALDGNFEILEIALPAFESVVELKGGAAGAVAPDQAWAGSRVRLEPSPNDFAFIGPAQPASPAQRIWIRRAASKDPPHGVVYVPADGAEPGHRVPFQVDALPAASARNDKAATARVRNWAHAASAFFAERSGAFYAFASARVRSRYLHEAAGAKAGAKAARRAELALLMETTSGRRSLQAALEHERPLYLAESRVKPSIPIERVAPPKLAHHPWAEMQKALRQTPRDEALAKAAPAEFYFARVKSFAKFIELLDWLADWGEPAADLLDAHSEDRATLARYQDELALESSGLSRVLGPSVIEDVAVVGSDPYVHEGSDVTLLFRVKNANAFETGLAAGLVARAEGHGTLEQTSFQHEGIQVSVTRSADGRVRRHRAQANGIEIVSNSPNAIRRVLSTLTGHRPSLAGEPDFQYLLARESSVANDALVYIGDRFVAAVTSPQQKIGEARRQIALAELSAPGYAALLAGWLDGKSAGSKKALLDAKWLDKSELSHSAGGVIQFEPGSGASSVRGTPGALEPLLDQPEISKVRPIEAEAYAVFASEYSSLWSDKIDPIALSLTLDEKAGERSLGAELRVLPLLRREYREWVELVGDARVSAPELASGARLVAAISKDARVRGLLDDFGNDFVGSQKLRFDWLGDYVALGLGNRNELANAVLPHVRQNLERPRPGVAEEERDFSEQLVNLPVYAVVELKSSLAAGVALTALRQKANEAAPGAAQWGQAASYRGQGVVKVSGREFGETLVIYYALLPSAFVIALNEATLHDAIDQVLDHPPVASQRTSGSPPSSSPSGQLLFELGGDKYSALMRIVAWFAQAELLEGWQDSAALAEAVLRGAPETQSSPVRLRTLLRSYFGSVPLTVDGRAFEASPEGARDPVRGTAYAPTYPDVPVPGSPLDRVLSGLRYIKSEQSYDAEPGHTANEPRQSLHVKLSIKTRPLPAK